MQLQHLSSLEKSGAELLLDRTMLRDIARKVVSWTGSTPHGIIGRWRQATEPQGS